MDSNRPPGSDSRGVWGTLGRKGSPLLEHLFELLVCVLKLFNVVLCTCLIDVGAQHVLEIDDFWGADVAQVW